MSYQAPHFPSANSEIMRHTIPVVLLVSASWCPPLISDELNYHYAQLSSGPVDLDIGERDISGFRVKLDYAREVFDTGFIRLQLGQTQYDNVSFFDISQQDAALAIGLYHSLSWRVDLYTEGAYSVRFTDLADRNETDHGIAVKAGVRWLPFETYEELELELSGGYQSIEDAVARGKRASFGSIGVRWNFTPWLSANIGLEQSSKHQSWNASVRVSF